MQVPVRPPQGQGPELSAIPALAAGRRATHLRADRGHPQPPQCAAPVRHRGGVPWPLLQTDRLRPGCVQEDIILGGCGGGPVDASGQQQDAERDEQAESAAAEAGGGGAAGGDPGHAIGDPLHTPGKTGNMLGGPEHTIVISQAAGYWKASTADGQSAVFAFCPGTRL